jgi:hypothetical protein
VFGYGSYLAGKRERTRRLENYLREEKRADEDRGKHTILHLMGQLAMTEFEILAAAFRSDKVTSVFDHGWQGREECLLFEYTGDDLPQRTPF